MTSLGIHHLTAVETDPAEFVSIAAAVGCKRISVFTQTFSPQSGWHLVTRNNIQAFKDRLDSTGVQVTNIECFMITPHTDIESFRSSLELGAQLNARGATALLYDADEARVIDQLSRLCELTAEYGLHTNIEFMPLAPRWKTLSQAVELMHQINQPNLGLGIDLLHMIRSGSPIEDLANLPPEQIHYAQICDSISLDVTEEYANEAGNSRLAPAEGHFPIQRFLQTLPAGTPIELEVPQQQPGSARERVKRIFAAGRRQMETAEL